MRVIDRIAGLRGLVIRQRNIGDRSKGRRVLQTVLIYRIGAVPVTVGLRWTGHDL